MNTSGKQNLLDPKMLEMLVCPLTKSTLKLDLDANELISEKAALAYPIRDGIPILLPSEARPLEDDPLDNGEND